MELSCIKKIVSLVAFCAILGISFLIGGLCIYFIKNQVQDYVSNLDIKEVDELTVDYTNCYKNLPGGQSDVTCPEFLKNNTAGVSCDCVVHFNVTRNITGPITVYYQLENFDLTPYAESRDNVQLSGTLDPNPSEKCEPYRYANTTDGLMPIVPCGAMADAMFNDTMGIIPVNDTELRTGYFLPRVFSGLISDKDKTEYRNPIGNLKNVCQNFTKPVNWRKSVYELIQTKNDTDNIGLQNEAFVIWMKTNPNAKVIRNPLWRLKQEYLNAGTYNMHLRYDYPLSRYNGTRKFIITSEQKINNTLPVETVIYDKTLGIVSMALGAVLLVTSAVVFFMYKMTVKKEDALQTNSENKNLQEKENRNEYPEENINLNSSMD